MSKYIDADKLIAKIERRLKDYWEICFHDVKAYNEDSNVRELKELLTLIDSLQQEQPEVDLEKEIQDYCKENVTGVNPIYTADSLIYSLLPKTARHFYELGLNARKEA